MHGQVADSQGDRRREPAKARELAERHVRESRTRSRRRSRRSEGQAQTQGVVRRGVDVAAGDGIADPEELEVAVGVAPDVCGRTASSAWWSTAPRLENGHQVEVELVVGQRAVLDHDVVDGASPSTSAYSLRIDHEPPVLASDRDQPVAERDARRARRTPGSPGEFMLPTSGATVRSGVTSSTLAPPAPAARRRPGRARPVVVVDEDVALARNEPLITSQVSIEEVIPRLRNSVFGRPPVATTTTSGSSASTTSASARRRTGSRRRDVCLRERASRRCRSGHVDGARPPRAAPGRPQRRWPPARRLDALARPAPGPPRAPPDRHRRPPLCAVGRSSDVRQPVLPPGRRVVDALGVAGLVDRVEAVVGADAGPDPVLVAGGDLATRCGSAICARVMPTRSTSPSRRANRAVATSEMREACITGTSTARLISPANSRCGADGVPIDGITFASVASLSIVPRMTLRKSMPSSTTRRGAQRLVTAQSRRRVLVHRHPDADDEVGPDRCPHRPDHPSREGHPVLEAPAELVAAVGWCRGQEAVEQVPVGLQLDAVEAGLAAPARGAET